MSTALERIWFFLVALCVLVILPSLMVDPTLAFRLLTPAMLLCLFGIVRGLLAHQPKR